MASESKSTETEDRPALSGLRMASDRPVDATESASAGIPPMQGLPPLISKVDTQLHMAAFEGNIDILRAAQAEGRDLGARDGDRRSLFHWASSGGRVAVMRYLLDVLVSSASKLLDAQDSAGWTPLLSATSANRLPAVRLLLDLGASPDVSNRRGQQPLHLHKGSAAAVRMLLSCTKDPDAGDALGMTALHRAAVAGQVEAAAALLDGGVDANRRDTFRRTALHLACEDGQIGTAALLLARGADASVPNADGKRALELYPAAAGGAEAVRKAAKRVMDMEKSRAGAGAGTGAASGGASGSTS